MKSRAAVAKFGVAFAALATIGAGATSAGAAVSDTVGKSTVEQRIVPGASAAYRFLELGAGEPYTVRQDLETAGAERAKLRTSLVYFGQLSDFQLADEESPARVEVVDPFATPTFPIGAAWRPWEALEPHLDEAMIQQVNQFAAASPVANGSGGHRAMDLTIDTGDSADNQQLNETLWVRTLLEGGTLKPNSGVNKSSYSHPLCPKLLVPGGGEASRYTGVQDYDDYFEGTFPEFYDPDSPAGPHAAWPKYPGLMDEAQESFAAAGLKVPSYVAFGNHDALVQGNAAANAAFEQVATGCLKPMGPVPSPNNLATVFSSLLDPAKLLSTLATSPQDVMVVPGDPKRQFVSKKQYKDIFKEGSQEDGHGFDFVDAAEETGSNGAAGYYSWSPTSAVRFISVDTVAEAGTVVTPTGHFTADGNIDDPQFKWLRDELETATEAEQLVVIFSHHAPESLVADAADELAPPCTVFVPSLGHDVNAGCDLDPRKSEPIHLEADAVELMHEFPNAIAWVAGHSHDNVINPYPDPSGPGGFWSIRVAAEADWPQQSRLLEVFDNKDGTLSIFGTLLDHVGQSVAPASGTAASEMDFNDLASAGRTMSFNDFQFGAPIGEGQADDRNVELLLDDPRI